MLKSILLLAPLALLGACAALWMDPIHQVGPNTYSVTHTMYAGSPVKGVRQGTIDRATEKCARQGLAYKKLREEMTPGGALSYTLTFECQTATK